MLLVTINIIKYFGGTADVYSLSCTQPWLNIVVLITTDCVVTLEAKLRCQASNDLSFIKKLGKRNPYLLFKQDLFLFVSILNWSQNCNKSYHINTLIKK